MLSARGWTILVIGVAGTIAAIHFGQRDLIWFGVLLILLPVVAVLLVGRTKMSLSLDRWVRPGRVALGERMSGHLALVKRGQAPLGLLRFEEAIAPELGRRPRFTVHRFTGEWERRVTYPLIGLARGRFQVGPLLVRSTDPFGLAKIDRRFSSTREVMVTPKVHPLIGLKSTSGAGQTGDARPQKIGLIGADDVLIREYRAGDDVRRIHWRSTAHRNEIMVRREEQAWDPAVALVLDNRLLAHAGTGRDTSFEWAVSAVSSIGTHLIAQGFRLDLFDSQGFLAQTAAQDLGMSRDALLVAMTDARLQEEDTLSKITEAGARQISGDLVVAVTGRLSMADARSMATMRASRSQALAIVIDPDSFTSRRFRASEEQVAEHQRAISLLSRQGWRISEATHRTAVPEAWQALDKVGMMH